LIYPDDFEVKKGTKRFASSLGKEWQRAKPDRWQREKTVDPYLPAPEKKINDLLPKDRGKDTELQERLRWELRRAKTQYAKALASILEQLEGGE
jgi:hypothetical protein